MKKDGVVYKEYNQGQGMLLPPSLEEVIPEKHLVRVINRIVEEMDLEAVYGRYKGGGTSSYQPKMLIKIIIYAYATQIYSGRQIAKQLRESIPFMWLSGGNQPDFRTINRFRGDRLKGKIQEVFTEVLEYLIEAKYIRFEQYFVDGTKIEANANKYSFVWKKSTSKYKQQLLEKVAELFEKIDQINEEENRIYGDRDLEELGEESEVTSEDLKKLADRMSEKLIEEPENKQIKKKLKILRKDFIPRLEKYENYEKTFQGRNSFSKTDEDATFMRMKDDHMRNRSLKPGYNVQIGTEDQFVLGFSIHQNATDSPTLIEHMQQLEENLGKLPKTWIADAGYGSEENYLALEEKDIEAYVKYNTFYQETKKHRKPKESEKYLARNFIYDEAKDCFYCPENKELVYEKTVTHRTDNGFETERRLYYCHDCEGCPVREKCTKSKFGRRIQYSPRLTAFRKKAYEKLTSQHGKTLSSKRMTEPEAVFGLFKGNKNFKRFHLRGLEKAEVEWGLLCIAHNLQKIAAL